MAEYRRHILVIRLSALGDVAILRPVVFARAQSNPDVLFTVAAPPLLEPLFRGVENIQFLPVKKKQPVKDLYRQMSAVAPTTVADMHWVNRVIGVDWLFRLHGTKVVHIHKDRRGRKRLTRNRNKVKKQLTPSWKRYDEVFDRCGLASGVPSLAELSQCYWGKKSAADGVRRIGIAPFAQHRGKIWPENRMRQLIDLLSKEPDGELRLFGSREESELLENWALPYPNVVSLAGKQSFAEELELIARLDVMVSMDSANLHFASCLGVPVVSLWGATHPYGGFAGWRQNPAWALSVEMDCRPCSMYGNKPCRYGDYRCLNAIPPEAVAEKVREILR